MEKCTTYRILAFGDSLTEGTTHNLTYINPRYCHPYTLRLQELLQDCSTKFNFEIANAGIWGEFAKNEMTSRLPKVLQEKGPYNLVIILGGTNDLGEMFSLEDVPSVFTAIQELHLTALQHGANTVLMTIPESDYTYNNMGKEGTSYVKQQGEEGRCLVNNMLRDFSSMTPGVILCDLDKDHPHTTLGKTEKEEYWDDGLHYTPKGYDRMAELIFQKIKDIF